MKTPAILAMAMLTAGLHAEENPALHLVATIPLPGVKGRFDHSAIDLEGQRLFVTGRDANTIEVIDLRTGRHVQTIPGFPQPQGAWYNPSTRKLFVSTRNDGSYKIVDGDSLKVIESVKLSVGANVIAYDPVEKLLYIGHGGKQVGDAPGQKQDPGQIAIVDAASGKKIGNIETDPELRPGAIIVEQSGSRLITTNALGSHIIIIDRKSRAVLARWALPKAERSGVVALDEARHRLFVGMRNPSRVLVFDSDSGKEIATFPTLDGIDRLLYDADTKRVYATGSAKTGEHQGSIEAYRQLDADHYELIEKIPTGQDGGTSLLVPETGMLYVALPQQGERAAEIKIYATRSDPGDLPHYKPAKTVYGPIRTVGDALGGQWKAWEQGFARFHPNVRFIDNLTGSEASVGGLVSEASDLGPNGRDATLMDLLAFTECFGYPPAEITVASGTFDLKGASLSPVIFVQKDNPVSKLTLRQLDGIFGAERSGGWRGSRFYPENGRSAKDDIRTWGQLGLSGDWMDKPIHTYGYAFTAMSKFFEKKVFNGGDKWNPSYRQYVETGSGEVADGPLAESVTIDHMLTELSNDRYGMGWTGYQYAKDYPQVKPVALAANDGGPYVEPTRESYRDRSYPLIRDILVCLNHAPGEAIDPKFEEFLRYVLSYEGQADVIRLGRYLPLPPQMVREQLKKLE